MFFQNIAPIEFSGDGFPFGQNSFSWKIGPNVNIFEQFICWNKAPFNTVGNTSLTINFSLDNGVYYSPITVAIPSGTEVTVPQIIESLNNDSTFSAWFVAQEYNNYKQIMILSRKRDRLNIRTYVSNTSAETVLNFNAKAPVKELPSYYQIFTVDNSPNMPNTPGILIQLDPDDPVDAAIITAAGLDPLNPQEDWQLLAGANNSYLFYIYDYDDSNRVVSKKEFPAGSEAGDVAKQTIYVYSDGLSSPSTVFEIPYILTSSDITEATP